MGKNDDREQEVHWGQVQVRARKGVVEEGEIGRQQEPRERGNEKSATPETEVRRMKVVGSASRVLSNRQKL